MQTEKKQVININMQGEGIFRIQKLKNNEVIYDSGEFNNLILNNGYDILMGTENVCPFMYCRVGTDNTAEAATQSALVSQLAFKQRTAVANTINTTAHYLQVLNTYTFPVGSVVGTLAELGVGSASTGNTLFSRVLVKDGGGTPTTISVLADEQLIVYYTFRLYQPTTDLDTSTVGSYDVILRSANINTISTSYTGWSFGTAATTAVANDSFKNAFTTTSWYRYYENDIEVVTSQPSETGVTTGMESFTTNYVGGGVLDITFTCPTGSGNYVTGLRSVLFKAGPGTFQCQFNPKIPKTATDRVIFTFRFTFSRRT